MNTNPIDLTDFAVALVTLFIAVITRYLVPMIKSKLSESQFERVRAITWTAVEAAEQLYKNGTLKKEDRKNYVNSILKSHGFNLDYNQIEAIIESSVHILPKTNKKKE